MVIWKQLSDEADYMISVKADPEPGNKKRDIDLDIHILKRDIEWVKYIFNNRRAKDELSADVIMGPIANDTIFDTLGIISSGYLKPEEALSMLEIGPEYRQVAIKTEKALKKLLLLEKLMGE